MKNVKVLPSIIRLLKKHTKKFEEPVVEQVASRHDAFRVLVSTMLSLRTKDATTTIASKRLFREADSPRKLACLSRKKIEKLIYPVGFYKTKAKHLQQMSDILLSRYQGSVPGEENALLSLPGVGRKTANLVLSLSFKKDAICVDTHVHRISNRLGLIRTKNPEETEKALMKILKKKYWPQWNMWLVMWGQNVCHPVSPHCSTCPLQRICPQVGVTISR